MSATAPDATKAAKGGTSGLPTKWRRRLKALYNIPPVLRMVWDCAPRIVLLDLMSRVLAALVPLGALEVTKYIIDALVAHADRKLALPHYFWRLVVAEFLLACLATILSRLT